MVHIMELDCQRKKKNWRFMKSSIRTITKDQGMFHAWWFWEASIKSHTLTFWYHLRSWPRVDFSFILSQMVDFFILLGSISGFFICSTSDARLSSSWYHKVIVDFLYFFENAPEAPKLHNFAPNNYFLSFIGPAKLTNMN